MTKPRKRPKPPGKTKRRIFKALANALGKDPRQVQRMTIGGGAASAPPSSRQPRTKTPQPWVRPDDPRAALTTPPAEFTGWTADGQLITDPAVLQRLWVQHETGAPQ